MFRSICLWIVAAGFGLCSCRSTPAPSAMVTSAPAAAAVQTPAVRPLTASHTRAITVVALDAAGSAAATADRGGFVRLWPSLDGKQEPIVIALHGIVKLSLASHRGSRTIAAIDQSDRLRVVSVNPAGVIRHHEGASALDPVVQAAVLPDAEHILVLHRDHSIRLIDRQSKVLARYERANFRPMKLLLSSDGRRVMAVTRSISKQDGGESVSTVVYPLRVSTAAKPELAGDGRSIDVGAVEHTSLSPAGDLLATLSSRTDAEGGAVTRWEVTAIDLATRARKVIALELPANPPSLGFIGSHRVLVSRSGARLAWSVDLQTGETNPIAAPPMSNHVSPSNPAFASGRQVVGFGRSLFVQDGVTGRHDFIGYSPFATHAVALSPAGKAVAWADNSGHIVVEPVDRSGPAVVLPPRRWQAVADLGFIDDDRLVVVGSNSEVVLYDRTTAKEVDRSGFVFAPSQVAVVPDFGLVGVHPLAAPTTLRATKRGFDPAAIIAAFDEQPAEIGVVRYGKRWHVWTLGIRSGAGAELRLRVQPLERGKGELPDALDMPALLSGSQQWGGIDDRGYLFGYSNVGNEAVVWIGKEPLAVEDPRKLASVPGRLHRLAIGPRGRQVAAVIDDGLVRMLDVRTGKPLWTFAASADIVGPRWSADGSLFAIATLFGGGVVLDARTGDAILQRCGSRFERSTALRVEAFADAVCLCEG